VSKYLESRTKSSSDKCKLESRRRLHILCRSGGYLSYMSRRKHRDWLCDGFDFVLYLISDFLI